MQHEDRCEWLDGRVDGLGDGRLPGEGLWVIAGQPGGCTSGLRGGGVVGFRLKQNPQHHVQTSLSWFKATFLLLAGFHFPAEHPPLTNHWRAW